jgi:endonuclease/exonuclease/phosphatase family metal-dependent hydrolase
VAGIGDHPRGRAGLLALAALARRSALLCVLLAAACSAPLRRPAVSAPGAPITLAVVTWNTHEGRGHLARLVADLADGRLTGSSPADFAVLIQEAVAGMHAAPDTIAGQRQLSVAFEPVGDARAKGNAILSTQPLMSTRVIALPRARQPRSALAATIRVADAELFLVNAHFENRVSLWRGLVFGDTARGRQATALLAQLPSGPGIAGGDLNTSLGPNEPALKAFKERFHDTPSGPTEPTFRNRLVLDHLFFDLPDGWRVERRVLADTYGSDHHPVLGIITAP